MSLQSWPELVISRDQDWNYDCNMELKTGKKNEKRARSLPLFVSAGFFFFLAFWKANFAGAGNPFSSYTFIELAIYCFLGISMAVAGTYLWKKETKTFRAPGIGWILLSVGAVVAIAWMAMTYWQ